MVWILCEAGADKDHSDNLDLLEFEKMCRLAHPEMTKEQVEKLANQKQVIRSDRETVSQCLQLVEQLRQQLM